MKFQAVLFVSFLPSVLGWWNCRLPKGGDLGTCLWDGDLKTELTCGQGHPCKTLGNGCIPIGSGIANCS
ncbi:hypothetical protein CABS01_10771 [Colletotrichum abscissum]|uniref:Uncharacterized protein n=3 Tax=Colletotrichum acutatum species complex TaxID=2707335 RepID=A0A9P7QZH8_9PEZI|nr:uncharacterized protein CCOS01_08940 [Colletotrichum costaricense]XP_060398850.1 uncharacterized protein CABS01_10771 [Colletotrichum abscissum]KAG7045112.1 hypothetical protein JMJ77_0009200 [Colletotrichum scovillei]KAK1457775.1 hypothetical protein CMEL01_15758 [Colletotrichum melonis]KAK1710645.1 hypothetical protein BDP67DRAFT_520466 [Colletotrichum lupini]KAK1497793.1 hypothetical protein CABS01_10771 [Colletotrichum abscissum]KAK1523853.1 hypothetical protein CCOS01_08940 [Colletotr